MKSVVKALEEKTIMASKSSTVLTRSSMPPLEIGDEVVRGPDWKWDNQDGGDGTVGEVTEICDSSVPPRAGQIIVKWPGGIQAKYGCMHLFLSFNFAQHMI